MQPSDYGPFPYTPINRRPQLKWPNGARVALWVIPNIEFFSLQVPLPGHPWEKAPGEAPTVRAWGQRDYGNRIGIFRLMDVLTKHGIRATATVNSAICDHHPQILEDAVKLGWEFMGHNKVNSIRLTGLSMEQEREVVRGSLKRLHEVTGKRPVGLAGRRARRNVEHARHSDRRGLPVCFRLGQRRPALPDERQRQAPRLPAVLVRDQRFAAALLSRPLDRRVRNDDQTPFDVLYAEGAQSARVMAICLHPFIIGTAHRIGGLDSALKYICSHAGVWKATGEEIVQAYLASGATF